MTTEKVLKMLAQKFTEIASEKRNLISDVSLFFVLKSEVEFKVMVDTIPGVEIDILADLPLLVKIIPGIKRKIHAVVAGTLLKIADSCQVPYERAVAKMNCDNAGQLSLIFMNGWQQIKPLTVEELFELNE